MWRTTLAVATLGLCSTTLMASAAAEVEPVPADGIEIPRDTEAYGCGADGYRFSVRGYDGKGTALDFAKREWAAWIDDDQWGLELILVLGVSDDALWTLEMPMGSDACDDCSSPILRETRFDGGRREHYLIDRLNDDRSVAWNDRVLQKLDAWTVLETLRPVPYELNRDQPLETGGLSSWLLRVRSSQHGRSYVWRHRTESVMCWCNTSFELATYVWDR